jgi:hypothetical protein
MACRNDPEAVSPRRPAGPPAEAAVPPLEAWLARDLHARWDSVTTETLPEELLALLAAAC